MFIPMECKRKRPKKFWPSNHFMSHGQTSNEIWQMIIYGVPSGTGRMWHGRIYIKLLILVLKNFSCFSSDSNALSRWHLWCTTANILLPKMCIHAISKIELKIHNHKTVVFSIPILARSIHSLTWHLISILFTHLRSLHLFFGHHFRRLDPIVMVRKWNSRIFRYRVNHYVHQNSSIFVQHYALIYCSVGGSSISVSSGLYKCRLVWCVWDKPATYRWRSRRIQTLTPKQNFVRTDGCFHANV